MAFDLFNNLITAKTEEDWSRELFELANNLGFEQTLFAVLKSKTEPLENAYIKSNYSEAWRETYDHNKMGYIDPTVAHTMRHTVPLLWTPEKFKSPVERNFFEEASSYGLQTGIIFPIHGMNGEYGMFSFVSDRLANSSKRDAELFHVMSSLALLRDYVFETSRNFAHIFKPSQEVHLTKRELEVLKWTKAGKSSWEIGRILNCSESTVNFHVTNIRLKFNVHSKQHAVIKAIQLGLIDF